MSGDRDLLRQIAHLSPAKQKLLLAKLEARRRAERRAEAIPVSPLRETGEPLPPSHAQERLWFLHQLDPASPAYHLPSLVRLDGELSARAMAQALGRVADRHESLRASFPADPTRPGRPRLAVAPPGTWAHALPVVDLGALTETGRDAEARRLAHDLADRPFDLEHGPLLRRALLRLGPAEHLEHRLALTLHHVISDGWSRGLLVREVTTAYGAFAAGRADGLPALPIGYADYAHWLRLRLDGDRLETLSAHWREVLDGAPAALELPFDRPPRPTPSHRGDRFAFEVPAATTAALEALARHHQTTLFTVLSAAYAAFLARHGGQREVVLGTPVAGRDRREVEDLIGLFVNTLALRLPGATGTPDALVETAKARVADAFEHADMPFERLVADLDPDRSAGRPPVFQALLVLQNLPAAGGELPGLAVSVEAPRVSTAKAELTLHLSEVPAPTGKHLAASLEYARDLFDRATIEALAARLPVFLQAFARDRSTPAPHLPLLPPSEASDIATWGAVTRPAPAPPHPLTRFREVTQRFPDRIAVVDGDRHLTYSTVAARAAARAAALRRAGARPGDVVAVEAERSAELMPAILGIWAAGAAYLPLDPSHPEERRRYTVEDAGARVFPDLDDHPANADTDPDALAPPPGSGPEHTAYVIYTSGSTGHPKGVPVSLGQVSRLFTSTERLFDFSPDAAPDTWCLFHSPAFDFSVWEIWGALLT